MLSGPLFYQLYLGWRFLLERDLFALPLRMGGLGVINPVVAATCVHEFSVRSTAVLLCMPWSQFELDGHIEAVMQAKSHHHRLMSDIFANLFNSLLPSFDLHRQRAILRAKECNLSS